MKRVRRAALLLVSCLLAPAVHAETYPSKPVQIVVPYAPGGGTDILARHVAEGMAKVLGKTVLVENRPGAGTNIGASAVAKSAPDGYTLLLGDLALAANPSLFRTMPYEPTKDLAPVAMVGTAPLVLVTGKSLNANSMKELVALAKAKSGELSVATAGYGNPPHIAAEVFKSVADIDLIVVPYKGVGPALTDVLGGRVSMLFTGISSTKSFIEAGQVKALAVTGTKRESTLPNVPTTAEAGYPQVNVTSWWGLFGPAGLPKEVVSTLNEAVSKTLAEPEMRERLAGLSIEAAYGPSEVLSERLRSETERWGIVIKKANITLD